MGVALFLAVLLNQKMQGRAHLPHGLLPAGGPGLQHGRAAVLAPDAEYRHRHHQPDHPGGHQRRSRLFGYVSRAIIYVQEITAAFFLGLNTGKYSLLQKVIEAGFPAANRVPLWVQSPLWSKMSVVLLMVWGCGTMMLIFLVGLNNIPKEMHEAAEVDGASNWQRFWKITFPLLTPYIFYNLVVGLISALQIFEPIFVLYRDNQPLLPSTISMVYYLWQKSFSHFEIGYGSAISWVILVIILVVTLIQFKLQNRWVTYDVY